MCAPAPSRGATGGGPKRETTGPSAGMGVMAGGGGVGAAGGCGGTRLSSGPHEHGYFLEPAVFDNVKASMRVAQEEIFGPVISVIRVASFDEALEAANAVRFGLSAAIFTQD